MISIIFNIHKINQNPCSVQPHIQERNNSKRINQDGKEGKLKAATDSKGIHHLAFMLIRKQIKYDLNGTSPFNHKGR